MQIKFDTTKNQTLVYNDQQDMWSGLFFKRTKLDETQWFHLNIYTHDLAIFIHLIPSTLKVELFLQLCKLNLIHRKHRRLRFVYIHLIDRIMRSDLILQFHTAVSN